MDLEMSVAARVIEATDDDLHHHRPATAAHVQPPAEQSLTEKTTEVRCYLTCP